MTIYRTSQRPPTAPLVGRTSTQTLVNKTMSFEGQRRFTRKEACRRGPESSFQGSAYSLAYAIFFACDEVLTVLIEELPRAGVVCVRTIPALPQRDERLVAAIEDAVPVYCAWQHGR